MRKKKSEDATPGGALHNLTHKIPGVPEHDESRGAGHQGTSFQSRRGSANDKLNNKGGHGLHGERERHVMTGVQDRIARFFGKD
ncbi:hypothetical protein GCM10009839_58040 [Catenulispora yoronensis]|uniref:Uncharacterized protein n=1 Tax=Catenulispora yoronensis TaxID=450799 RepID=A0ABP5GKT6_9ACTN